MILRRIINKALLYIDNKKYKYVAPNVIIPHGVIVSNKDNLIIKEGGGIESGTLILNINAKFVLGRYSCAGPNLLVVTGNHIPIIGKYIMQVNDNDKKEMDLKNTFDQDVIVDDDVWIGANVILLNGSHVGRGAIVGAGTVIRTKIPPYAMVAGNPGKVVGFRFTPEQIEQHEIALYEKQERLPRQLLDKNYKKYYLDRLQIINDFFRI